LRREAAPFGAAFLLMFNYFREAAPFGAAFFTPDLIIV